MLSSFFRFVLLSQTIFLNWAVSTMIYMCCSNCIHLKNCK
uniref:Uncharacterized protein n=1 Tax=Anguilla anguilla TaxID=7936 RepID=A0A0E9UTH9_ANGAN